MRQNKKRKWGLMSGNEVFEDYVFTFVKWCFRDNILLNDGRVQIADFGLSRFADKTRSVHDHNRGIGTPGYMSPQVSGGIDGEKFTTADDVFSYAMTCLEMNTKHRPFQKQVL